MADENVTPVFKGVDETGMDFQYQVYVNKLCGLFYRHQSSVPGQSSDGTICGTVSLD